MYIYLYPNLYLSMYLSLYILYLKKSLEKIWLRFCKLYLIKIAKTRLHRVKENKTTPKITFRQNQVWWPQFSNAICEKKQSKIFVHIVLYIDCHVGLP